MKALVVLFVIVAVSGCTSPSGSLAPSPSSVSTSSTIQKDLKLTFQAQDGFSGGADVQTQDARFVSDGGPVSITGSWTPGTPAASKLEWTIFIQSSGQSDVLSRSTAAVNYSTTITTDKLHTYSIAIRPAAPGATIDQTVHVEIRGPVQEAR